jgi:hypothetical protein
MTGLEPATTCVTGKHSNQLNYITILVISFKSEIEDTVSFQPLSL